MERDPQPGLWGHGPQGSHDATSAGHPLLDEGGHKGTGGPDLPPRNAKAKGRQPPCRRLSHSGTSQRALQKGGRVKGPWEQVRARILIGQPTGRRSHPRECSTAVTTSSRRNALETVVVPTIARSSRMVGSAMQHPQSTLPNNAPTVGSWWNR